MADSGRKPWLIGAALFLIGLGASAYLFSRLRPAPDASAPPGLPAGLRVAVSPPAKGPRTPARATTPRRSRSTGS